MNIISVSNVRHDNLASNTLDWISALDFARFNFHKSRSSFLSHYCCHYRVAASITCCRSTVVIRAANSKRTGTVSPFFSFAFIKWPERPTSIVGADKGTRDDIFFYVPLVFHARSVISPVNFTKLARTAISLRLLLPAVAPAGLLLSHCYAVPFYSHFPATYATRRFFFIAHAGNLFGWSFFRELVIKIVTPTNCVRRTRFVRSIARVTRLPDKCQARENDGK